MIAIFSLCERACLGWDVLLDIGAALGPGDVVTGFGLGDVIKVVGTKDVVMVGALSRYR